MISISRLNENLSGDWICFDRHGEPLDIEIPGSIGPAAFLVTAVTDAVKRIDGNAVESMDRDQMWAVDALVLNRVVLQKMDGDLSVEDLITRVRALGYSWQISPISSL
ncbi:MAG TPA: hypothetical protein VK969_11525 [Acidimicrobiia bacterium]|nr:hypothetical protein [Acidimicrobiia bacterium]